MPEKRRYLGKNLVEYEQAINADLEAAGSKIRIAKLLKKGGEFVFEYQRSGLGLVTEEEKAMLGKIFNKYFPNFQKFNVREN